MSEIDLMNGIKSERDYDSYEHELISNYVRFGIKRMIEDYQHDKVEVIHTQDLEELLTLNLYALYHYDLKIERDEYSKDLSVEVRFTMPGDEEESFRMMKAKYHNLNITFEEMMCRPIKPEGI